MSFSNAYIPQLRARGYRLTPQRLAILQVLVHSNRHLSPAEIFDRARRELPGLTETTVYRTLEFLAENDIARPALAGNGHLVYELAGHDHHHLMCRDCGREREVDHKLLKTLYQKLETSSGYKLTGSHITFFGLCPTCQQ